MKHTILCVDDEKDNVDALERLFRRDYFVLKATSGADALDLLRAHPEVSLIISDQKMPQMEGVEFLSKSILSHPDAIRILLTGFTDIDSVIAAINSGQVYRYLTKPWDPVDLSNTVKKALERLELGRELQVKNAALADAFRELKTLDDAKNHFMILINHELKTPLTTVLSYLELLAESKLNAEQEKFVDRISKGADRLKSIVDDVLELVSAETGVMKTNIKKTSAYKLVEGLSQDFEEKLEQKKQKILINIDEDLSVKADVKVVRGVLSRLLDNAVKFGDPKSKISVEAREEKGQVQFVVANEGKPLSSEVIAKILKPFSLDEDIMHHSKGTGLGLSLSQALLKTHQSHLQFESPDGWVKVSFALDKSE